MLCRPFEHGAAIVVHSDDQVYRRPRHLDRRHDRRRRQFRLGGARRALPDAQRAGSQLPRRGLDRGGEAARARSPTSSRRASRCCATSAPRMSPFNAFQFIQGLETLPLRMREHCRNAQAVVDYLKKHPAVTRVIHPQRAGRRVRAPRRDLSEGRPRRPGRLRAARAARRPGARFIDALKLFYHVANIGDARSLAIHPAIDHAFAAVAGGAARRPASPRLCPPLGRHRAYRRHHRRSRPGAEGGGSLKAAAE